MSKQVYGDVKIYRPDGKGALAVDCVGDRENGFEWHLKNPRAITPKPVKGKLNFFEVEL